MQPDFSSWHKRPKCKSSQRLAEIISSEQCSGGSLIHIPLERDFISLNSRLDSLSERSGKMLRAALSPFSNATTCLIYSSCAFMSHKRAMQIESCFLWKANEGLLCVSEGKKIFKVCCVAELQQPDLEGGKKKTLRFNFNVLSKMKEWHRMALATCEIKKLLNMSFCGGKKWPLLLRFA